MKRFAFLLSLCIIIFSCNKKLELANDQLDSEKLVSIISNKEMKKIEGGSYEAFIGKDSGRIVTIETFYFDDSPVTNAEYLVFLKANPQWTRSKVLKLFADESYLKNWQSDYEIPQNANPNAPITNISWYAAEAYAKSVGKRLATINEWEFVGIADENHKDASQDSIFTRFILKSYQEKNKNLKPIKRNKPNYYGVFDMYDNVWEWTYDFNAVMMSGESRNDNTTNESLFCAGAAVTSSDLRNYAAFMRFALRGSLKANYCLNNLGFRCAKDLKN